MLASTSIYQYLQIQSHFNYINLHDTLKPSDISQIKLKNDSIQFINHGKLSTENSTVITSYDLLRKTSFNWFHIFQLNLNSFLIDLGLPSNFYEIIMRQSGLRRIGFNINDLEINDRLTNIFDLRDFRIDEVDSIIVISPLRAFLISNNNNEEAILFVEKKKISFIPYSRIKYLESPYDNLFFDGIFNVSFAKRWNFDFGITKHHAPYRFLNSEKDLWAGKIKLTHFLSDQINFNLIYRYSKSLSRFNEGVNIFNQFALTDQTLEDYLYDERRALPTNEDAYHKWTFNTLNFETQILLTKNISSSINIYYQNNLREFRDNEHKADSIRIFEDHKTNSLGININQFTYFLFNQLEFNLNFEKTRIESPFLIDNATKSFFSTYIIYTPKFSEYFIPSVFYKLVNKGNQFNKATSSYGFDIKSIITRNINLYAGYSKVRSHFSFDEIYFNNFNLTDTQYDVTTLYSKLDLNFSRIKIITEVYNKKRILPINSSSFYSEEQANSVINSFPEEQNLFGGSLSFQYSIWRIENRLNFYINEQQIKVSQVNYKKINHPRYLINFQSYYRGIHFKNNLDILAGFRINLFSSFYGKSFSPSKLYFVDIRNFVDTTVNFGTIKIPYIFTVDLFASGKVKEKAIIYFSLDNILNKKFYLVPYYPANDIQFKFGIAWEFEN